MHYKLEGVYNNHIYIHLHSHATTKHPKSSTSRLNACACPMCRFSIQYTSFQSIKGENFVYHWQENFLPAVPGNYHDQQ